MACFAALLFAASRGQAQSAVQLDLFRPTAIDGDGLAVAHAVAQGHLRFGGALVLDYAHDPLVWEAQSGSSASESRHIVRHQLVANAIGSLGLFDRLVVFGGLPVNLVQRGQATQDLGVPPADGAGVGNPFLGARVLLLPQRDHGFGLALQAELAFPLARAVAPTQAYSGDGRVTFHPQAIAHYQAGRLRVALDLGYRIRKDRSFALLEFGDELTFGLGARIRVARGSTILAEVHGSSSTSNVFGREETPVEALGGYEYADPSGVTVSVGAGAGQRGFGAPDARAIAMLRYTTPARARASEDDPIEDDEEPIEAAPPIEPESATESASAEVPPSEPTSDPLTDAIVPSETSESDGASDRDGDAIADEDDDCPDLPGIPTFHGCPHAPLFEITERIYFEFDSGRLDARSFEVLDDIANVLTSHPEVRVVRVEGHTDARGSHDYNLALSRRRAEAVTRYLVRRGVPASRIEIHGFGHTRQAAENAVDDDDHAQNRRVEFRIVGVE